MPMLIFLSKIFTDSQLHNLVEPGYYEDGSFGIRLENVLICKEANAKFNFGDKGYLAFEHITWVSIYSLISFFDVTRVPYYIQSCTHARYYCYMILYPRHFY